MFVPELVQNGLFFFCLFRLDMGLFDGQILAVLRDGRSWAFRQVLHEVGFSHARCEAEKYDGIPERS